MRPLSPAPCTRDVFEGWRHSQLSGSLVGEATTRIQPGEDRDNQNARRKPRALVLDKQALS